MRPGKEAYPVGSIHVLLSKLICLLTPPKKSPRCRSFQALPSVPSQREGKKNFLCKSTARNRMSQTFLGLSMFLAGFFLAVFSGPIARFQIAINKRILGVEFPFEWSRAGAVIAGALLSFSGLLTLFRLPPI